MYGTKNNMLVKLNGDRIARLTLLSGVFAPIAMMVIIIVVGQITPDYNPISDTISQMGTPNNPYSAVLNSGGVIYGILIGVTAYGFHIRLRYTTMAKTLVILLGIHAIGIMLLMVFPDSPDFTGKHFTDDILHNTFSAISYPALLTGILVYTGIARQEKALKVTAILGLAVVILNLPLPVITMFDPFKPIAGLLQRLFIASSFLWLVFTSLLLYKNHHVQP
jgi:hypothetical membrane protein